MTVLHIVLGDGRTLKKARCRGRCPEAAQGLANGSKRALVFKPFSFDSVVELDGCIVVGVTGFHRTVQDIAQGHSSYQLLLSGRPDQGKKRASFDQLVTLFPSKRVNRPSLALTWSDITDASSLQQMVFAISPGPPLFHTVHPLWGRGVAGRVVT
jgi:hypothetical protein